MPATQDSVLEPEPFEEPAVVPSITQSHLPVPLEQQRLYQAPTGESFAAQRNRFERQESLLFKKPESYGPARSQADRETPYSNRPLGDCGVCLRRGHGRQRHDFAPWLDH